jgi:hypothetical protein
MTSASSPLVSVLLLVCSCSTIVVVSGQHPCQDFSVADCHTDPTELLFSFTMVDGTPDKCQGQCVIEMNRGCEYFRYEGATQVCYLLR